MYNDNYLYLYEISEESLDGILSLDDKEIDKYIYTLVERFYGNMLDDKDYCDSLHASYKGSFLLEKFVRSNPLVHKAFTGVYTKTGLLRELNNDLYSLGAEKLVIN